jgi:hypothetical protein
VGCPDGAADAILYGVIAADDAGDNTILAAVADRSIRVHSLSIVATTPVNARFESGASGEPLTGYITLNSGVPYTLGHNATGWFQTDVGELLNLELSDAVNVGGFFTYSLVP